MAEETDEITNPPGLGPLSPEIETALARERHTVAIRDLTREQEKTRDYFVEVLHPVVARAVTAQASRDAAWERVYGAIAALLNSPNAFVQTITQGNRVAQSILAIGVVVIFLVILGVKVVDIDVTKLIQGAMGGSEPPPQHQEPAPAPPSPSPAQPGGTTPT